MYMWKPEETVMLTLALMCVLSLPYSLETRSLLNLQPDWWLAYPAVLLPPAHVDKCSCFDMVFGYQLSVTLRSKQSPLQSHPQPLLTYLIRDRVYIQRGSPMSHFHAVPQRQRPSSEARAIHTQNCDLNTFLLSSVKPQALSHSNKKTD